MAYLSQVKLSNTTYDVKAKLTEVILNDTSNYKAGVQWRNTTLESKTYLAQVGRHNTGGNNDYPGSISIIPYATDASPWSGKEGLFITKDNVKFENQIILHSGNYTDYTVSKSGTGATGTWGISISGNAATASACSGNAATATKLATARTISLTGDVTGSGTFDGSNNLSITTTVSDDSHTHNRIISNGTHAEAASSTNATSPTEGMLHTNGLYMTQNYNDSTTPCSYGNIINVAGAGSNQIFCEWKGSDSTSGGIWYRSHRDTSTGGWGAWRQVWLSGDSVTGAVWNDYAECRESDCEEFGYVLMENGDDTLSKTTERLSHFAGISSDTWGFSQGETDKAKTPIAVAGRVLAYPYQDRNNYKPGDCVCAAPGGTVDIMTREEIINWPDRIVGTVSCVPDYEEWGGGEGADREPVKVNNRIWIKVR